MLTTQVPPAVSSQDTKASTSLDVNEFKKKLAGCDGAFICWNGGPEGILTLVCEGQVLGNVRSTPANTAELDELRKDLRYDPSNNNCAAFVFTAGFGALEMVRLLLKDPRIDPNSVGSDVSALGFAAQRGQLAVVRLLLEDARVDPSVGEGRALVHAARCGQIDVVRVLLADERTDPTVSDNEPIRCAAAGGHVEVVRLMLLDPRVDMSETERETIISTAEGALKERVQSKED